MAARFSLPIYTTLDANGRVIPGARLQFYNVGTTTPRAVFSENDLVNALPNPVVADSAGRFPNIFLSPVSYDVALKDASGATISVISNYDGRDRGSVAITDIAGLQSAIGTLSASITTEQQARVSGDAAEALARQTLSASSASDILAIKASITSEQTARANADSALSSSIGTVSSTIGTLSATVSTQSSTIATLNGKVNASFSLSITADTGGQKLVSGIFNTNDGTTSDFLVLATKFAVTDTLGSSAYPFEVVGGQVKIKNAIIGELDAANIKAGTITADKIVSDSISKFFKSSTASISFTAAGQQVSTGIITLPTIKSGSKIDLTISGSYTLHGSATGVSEIYIFIEGSSSNGASWYPVTQRSVLINGIGGVINGMINAQSDDLNTSSGSLYRGRAYSNSIAAGTTLNSCQFSISAILYQA